MLSERGKRVRRRLTVVAVVVDSVAAAVPIELAAAYSSRLHSARWLYDHCKIRVSANAPADKRVGQKDGVALRGLLNNDSGGHPQAVYRWHIASAGSGVSTALGRLRG